MACWICDFASLCWFALARTLSAPFGTRLPRRHFILLAIRVEELNYSQIAARFDISVAEIEFHFVASSRVMKQSMDDNDP